MNRVSKEQLRQWFEEKESGKNDFLLVDVMPEKYFKEKHIPTAVNLSFDREDFFEQVKYLAGSFDRKIILYCKDFECQMSENAAIQLAQKGFSAVFEYQGGTEDWFL